MAGKSADFITKSVISGPHLQTIIATLLVVFAIFAIRSLVLIYSPVELFFDEAQYWSWSQTLDFGYFSKPPLLAWIIRGFTDICGDGEACVRLASPVLYSLTALFLGLLAARIAARNNVSVDATFFWTTLLFLTLPGVTFATRLISTDAPLLFFFARSLYFLDRTTTSKHWFNFLLLGTSIGLGLMAKYAMIYFVLCAAIWCLLSPTGRRTIFQIRMLIVPLTAFLFVLPNLWWNASRDWITFQHTKDNANWQGFNLQFDNMLEFIGAQIGILGPILFLAILIGLFSKREKLSKDAIFLLCFSVPVTTLMIIQATLSRAHANWAAVAFISYTILATYWLVKWRARPLLLAGIGVNIVALIIICTADIYADKLKDHRIGYSYKRVFGWQELADKVDRIAHKSGAKTIVSSRRSTTSQFLYYMRDKPYQIRTFEPDGRPRDHFEMSIPLTGQDKPPVLVISSCPVIKEKAAFEKLPQIEIKVRPGFIRVYYPYLSKSANISRADFC